MRKRCLGEHIVEIDRGRVAGVIGLLRIFAGQCEFQFLGDVDWRRSAQSPSRGGKKRCFVEIEKIAIGAELHVRRPRNIDIEQVRVAAKPASRAVLAKDPVHAIEVSVAKRQTVDARIDNPKRIECLLILAPADISNEAGIAKHDALPAKRDDRIGQAVIGDLQPVQFRRIRIGNDGICGASIYRIVVVFRSHMSDQVKIGQRRESVK